MFSAIKAVLGFDEGPVTPVLYIYIIFIRVMYIYMPILSWWDHNMVYTNKYILHIFIYIYTNVCHAVMETWQQVVRVIME